MKTSAIFVAVSAALASAQAPPEGTNKITCLKPNSNYCMGGDIIVRCDANGLGTAGRCSDNVAGYPPLGGVAECWSTTETSGDAACQKNCVVYAQPSFTLPASQCTPSASVSIATASATAPVTWTSSAADSSSVSIIYTTVTNGTVTVTVPCSTVPVGGASTTSVGAPSTTPVVVQTTPAAPAGTGAPPPPPVGGNNGTAPSGTNTPVGPTTSSTGPQTVPTGAAAANIASGALAAMGLVVAALL
ncbi:hypothetical protein V8C35DRAFT_176403 [Trichoderma chlorosporum]